MESEVLLRTGEAATRLGVSRQHVVDLCNQGKLPFMTVGTHRRISARVVDDMVAASAGDDRSHQSVWLHAALIPRLIRDPDGVISKARGNIARGRASGAIDTRSEPYVSEWEKALDDGVGRLISMFLDTSEHGATLRSSTPFAGILPQSEVRALKRAWRSRRNAAQR